MKSGKIIIFFAIILAVSVFVSSCKGTKEDIYRPMCYYNNSLLWEEETVQTDTENFEYIGEINSCVGADEKPAKDFECNYEGWLGAKLYKDENNEFYIKFISGKVFRLKENRVNGEITRVQGGWSVGK